MKRSVLALLLSLLIMLTGAFNHTLGTGAAADVKLRLAPRIITVSLKSPSGVEYEAPALAIDLLMDTEQLLAGGDISFAFPTEHLDFLDFKRGDGLNNAMFQSDVLEADGRVRILFAAVEAIESGVLGTYELLPNCPVGTDLQFELISSQLIHDDTTTILSSECEGVVYTWNESAPTGYPAASPALTSPPSVSATNTAPPAQKTGDANQNGRLDSGDAALILYANADKIALLPAQAQLSDFNGDGDIDSDDAAEILKSITDP